MSINQTLEQRGSRYGKFKDVAATTYAHDSSKCEES